MKKQLYFLIALAMFAAYSCQQTMDAEKEKEAIMELINEERAAFLDRDFSRVESTWMQQSNSRKFYMSQNGITKLLGWSEIGEDDKEAIENGELWENYENLNAEYSNFDITVYNKTALVYHDTHWSGKFKGEEMTMKQERILHLVKDNGKWKIDLMSMYRVPDESIEKNMKTAIKYHDLDPDDIDAILTEDFIGRNEQSRFTWNRENHRNYLSSDNYKTDSIFHQIAEGNWVATRFFREMDWQGKRVKFELMHFKRFEDGKIAEIWEYGDTQQVESGN